MVRIQSNLLDSKIHVPSTMYREVIGSEPGGHVTYLPKMFPALIYSCLQVLADNIPSGFCQYSSHLSVLVLSDEAFLHSPSQNYHFLPCSYSGAVH